MVLVCIIVYAHIVLYCIGDFMHSSNQSMIPGMRVDLQRRLNKTRISGCFCLSALFQEGIELDAPKQIIGGLMAQLR